MPTDDPYPHTFVTQGIVGSDGTLHIKFGPPANQMWSVSQVSIEMPMDDPVGCVADIRYENVFIASAATGARATAGGDPPIFLNGGETMSVNWSGSPPGSIGTVLAIYTKSVY